MHLQGDPPPDREVDVAPLSPVRPEAVRPDVAAVKLGCSPQQVRALIRAGRLRAIDLSTGTGDRPYWVIPLVEIDRFLAEGGP